MIRVFFGEHHQDKVGVGIQYCLGAVIARMEGQETLRTLVQRLPTLRLHETPLTYQPSLTFRALTALSVTWTA